MEANSSELTTFICLMGKYKFTKMPFGLKNAPAFFFFSKAVVEQFLGPAQECARNYIDDVLVYRKNWLGTRS